MSREENENINNVEMELMELFTEMLEYKKVDYDKESVDFDYLKSKTRQSYPQFALSFKQLDIGEKEGEELFIETMLNTDTFLKRHYMNDRLEYKVDLDSDFEFLDVQDID